jgi:hypothetical protein
MHPTCIFLFSHMHPLAGFAKLRPCPARAPKDVMTSHANRPDALLFGN